MKIQYWPMRFVAGLLVLLLLPTSNSAFLLDAQQPAKGTQTQDDSHSKNAAAPGDVSREKQGADAPLSEVNYPDAPEPQNGQATTSQSQSGGAQQQDNGRKPLGTAAAPYEGTSGMAASRPAGAAIAPGKQRRVRAIFISLGIVIGAGVAVGTVAALSHSSPSHPF